MSDGRRISERSSVEPRHTRRRALLLGLAAGSAVMPASAAVPAATAQARDDGELVADLLVLEQIAVVAYETAIERGVLGRRLGRVAALFRDQEREHAEALSTALRSLRGMPRPPAKVADVPRLSGARTRKEVLNVLIDLETRSLSAYYEAQQRLEDRTVLRAAAAIMANEGQHAVVLRQADGSPPLPSAFATGEE